MPLDLDKDSRIAYVRGHYVPLAEAKVSILDRGFLFADAIYEVVTVLNGRLVDLDRHLDRLERSLAAIHMPMPASRAEVALIHREIIERNQLHEGLVYSQVTRGTAERAFTIPKAPEPNNLFAFTQAKTLIEDPTAQRGLKIISLPDMRWKRRDIKSVGLLAQTLAKQAAVDAGADDAWMIEDGFVTEGTSNTAYLITEDNRLIARPNSSAILPGVTRDAVMELVEEAGLLLEERPFTLAEAQDAAEAFITSATTFVMPVVEIDGKRIGGGQPGPYARRLRALYIDAAMSHT